MKNALVLAALLLGGCGELEKEPVWLALARGVYEVVCTEPGEDDIKFRLLVRTPPDNYAEMWYDFQTTPMTCIVYEYRHGIDRVQLYPDP